MAIGRINATLTGVQPGGLAKIVPTSVAVGSGSGSTDTNGNITFSSTSSISLNGVFSSAYQNYRIVCDAIGTAACQLSVRLRVSGSDNSSANYAWGGITRFNNSATVSVTYSNGLATNFEILRMDNGTGGATIVDLINPFATQKTNFTVLGSGYATTATENQWWSGQMSVTTSYDSITLYPSAGTMTGTVRVYGYN